MSYKDKFYARYYSTHVVPRKGATSQVQLEQRARYYQRDWSKLLPTNKQAKIIDIGCGNGSMVWWLQKIGYAYAEGIDYSDELIEVARNFGIKNVTQADLMDFLITKRDCYDTIILRDVLEHFSKEMILDILMLCHASLKQEGQLILQVPNADTPFFGRIRYGDFTHELAFNKSSLQQLLGVMEFRNIRFYSTEPMITDVRSFLRFVMWKSLEALYRTMIYVESGHRNAIVTESIIAIAERN